MSNYCQWLRDAETFVRAVRALSGEWSVDVSIAPPLNAEECERIAKPLPHGIPGTLRDFYLTASAEPRVHFTWKPSKADLDVVGAVIPHQYTFYGGPELCPASQLLGHQEGLFGFADVFDELGGLGPAASSVIRQSVPVMKIANGDYLAWHIGAGSERFGIYYVCHEIDEQEELPIVRVADDLEHFLDVWQKLGYLGPEIWLLNVFLEDSPTRQLDANSPVALSWRRVLKTLGLPVVETK